MPFTEYNLDDITSDQIQEAELLLISALRSARPELDLRAGTALRDLLIRPAAEVYALNTVRAASLRISYSLRLMGINPAVANDTLLDNLMANFALLRQTGAFSVGTVRMRVNESKTYSVPRGYQLSGSDGSLYTTEQQWTTAVSVVNPAAELRLYTDTDGTFFFLLPVIAAERGLSTVEQDDALQIVSAILPGFIEATAYRDFTGGEAPETADSALTRIPRVLSYRGMDSSAAIAAKLTDQFTYLRAVQVAGFGNEAQLRDKHNTLGFALGNAVDVYVRTSLEPFSLTLTKSATKVADGVYDFILTADEAPGAYAIRAISLQAQVNALGSYPFTAQREAYNTGNTYHEFDTSVNTVEVAYSAWQRLNVRVTDVEPTIVDGAPVYPSTLELRVEVYVPQNLLDIQNYVDQEDQRSQNADHLVRGIVPCYVSISATIFVEQSSALDIESVKTDLVNYVNALAPGRVLTTSQIASVIHEYNIITLDMNDSGQPALIIRGTIPAADGSTVSVTGNALAISNVDNPEILVTPSTVGYFLDRRDIFLTERQQ